MAKTESNTATDFAAMKAAAEKDVQAEMTPREKQVASVNAPSDHSKNPGMVAMTEEDHAAFRKKNGPSRGDLVPLPHGDERDRVLLAATKAASLRRCADDAELTAELVSAVASVVSKRRKAGNSALKA